MNYSDYAKALNMSDHLHVRQAFEDTSGSKCVRVLNMARFYMQGLYRVLNMLKYASIMP